MRGPICLVLMHVCDLWQVSLFFPCLVFCTTPTTPLKGSRTGGTRIKELL